MSTIANFDPAQAFVGLLVLLLISSALAVVGKIILRWARHKSTVDLSDDKP